MGKGGTPARETSFVSLVAYGPNSDSAFTMRGYSLWNQAGLFPTHIDVSLPLFLPPPLSKEYLYYSQILVNISKYAMYNCVQVFIEHKFLILGDQCSSVQSFDYMEVVCLVL